MDTKTDALTSKIDALTSKTDALTSLYTYEGAKQEVLKHKAFFRDAGCHFMLIHMGGIKEIITEYGSSFAMAVLENQAGLFYGFFESRGIEAVCFRVVKDCFGAFFCGASDRESESFADSLLEKLKNSYYGRGNDMDPQIRIALCHIPYADWTSRDVMVKAGAAVESIPEGTSGTAVYKDGMEETPAYTPSPDHTLRLPAEDLTDYDSTFIAFAVRMLSGSRDLDSNTDIVIQRIGWQYGFDGVYINEFVDGHLIKTTNKWTRKDGIVIPDGGTFDFSDWDGFFVNFDERGFNIALDVHNMNFSERDMAFFEQEDIRSFINILLYSHDVPIGYIYCGKSEPVEELDHKTLCTLAHLSRIIAAFVSLRIEQGKQLDRIQSLSVDNQTGLLTYAAFQRKLRHLLRHIRPERTYAILSADISHFSHLNENFGYAEGDRVLHLFSKMLKSGKKDHITSCHVDADRFLIFMEEESRDAILEQIHEISSKFENYLNDRYPSSDLRVVTGVYYISNPNKDLLYMIDSANHARKSIKQSFTESVAVYTDEFRNKRHKLLDVVGSLHGAIDQGYIEAFLQPKFSMVHRTIVGAEALVRWRKPDGSYRFPDQFIPILEDAGLIVDLDMCVFRQVLTALARWQKDGKTLIPISVNFSRVHFRDENFYQKIVSITEEYGIDNHYIEVEVTESSFGENRENLYLQLRQLREVGFLVDIDDFGTGYSSLNMLMSAPVDIVKVDKSFIDHYETKEEQRYINQIGNLILSADKKIIFEGVETEDQIRMLTEYGYDHAQGYFFSRPIPLPEFEQKYIYARTGGNNA